MQAEESRQSVRRRKLILAAAAIAALTGAALYAAAASPVLKFRLFYANLEAGMTEAEVLDIFNERYPERAARRVPVRLVSGAAGNPTWSFILDPSDGRYNSEVILASFDRGRLRATEYHPD